MENNTWPDAYSDDGKWVGDSMSNKFNSKIMRMMEDKLIELMGMEEYMKFSDKVAQKVLREEIENMPDGDTKKFCLEHWDEIMRMK